MKIRIGYLWLLLALLSWTAQAQTANLQPQAVSMEDSLNIITNKNHKNSAPLIGGTLYLLSGKNAGISHQVFNGYACIDSFLLNASQSKALKASITAVEVSNLEALCLFSPNMGVELMTSDGRMQYLIAFDCGQIAYVNGQGLAICLADSEQLTYLKQVCNAVFDVKPNKLSNNEWIPMRKE